MNAGISDTVKNEDDYNGCPLESSALNCPRNHQGANLVGFCITSRSPEDLANKTSQQHGLGDAKSRGILSH